LFIGQTRNPTEEPLNMRVQHHKRRLSKVLHSLILFIGNDRGI